MDEILFFDSLSARFKPWYHSWPYVLELTTINLCLKIAIFTVQVLKFQGGGFCLAIRVFQKYQYHDAEC